MFSIIKMTVDGNNKVVSLDWCYETADGKYVDTHTLNTPAGNVPIPMVTTDVAVGWLTDQLNGTAEDYATALADSKARAEYVHTFCEYLPNDQGRFTKTVDPDPVATPY